MTWNRRLFILSLLSIVAAFTLPACKDTKTTSTAKPTSVQVGTFSTTHRSSSRNRRGGLMKP